jgi:two-component system, OmpR family, phosphate regulon sensor histidine kinase PhoR
MIAVICSVALLGGLLWTVLRYRRLRRSLRGLSEALERRSPFLSDASDSRRADAVWRRLVESANNLTSEARRLADQRAGQKTQLETTLSSLQEAVLVLDRNNYILLANKALTRMFPGAANAHGHRVESALQSAGFLQCLSAIRANHPVAEVEIEFTSASASTWVEITGTLIPDTAEQNGPWALFVLHDITRQKRLEMVRKEFVANVSHELKTPLSVIKGYAETLVDDHSAMIPDDRERFLRTILRHADRLTAIVDDLLTLSRLESNNAELRLSQCDLASWLRGTAEDLAQRFASTGHVLRVVAPEGAVQGTIDALKLNQVIFNLLDNAQKHTPSGTHVEIGLRLLADVHRVEFWVEDDGPGIPREDLPRIFERFYRVEKGRSRDKGGTGLGLSIVKHIVLLHGGRVTAKSEPGKGTHVSFTIPLMASSTEAPTPAEG